MGQRIIDGGVALAVLASAALIGLMLAAPFLPQRAAPEPVASATPLPSRTPEPITPPLGLFALRGPFSLGPCLALELGPTSYPVADDAPDGTAAVMWWARGMTGCDTRSSGVGSVEATVAPVEDPDTPDDGPIGYSVRFSLPLSEEAAAGAAVSVELTILARQSTQTLIQAVESMPTSGQGYVFDRVVSVEPELMPIPTTPPSTVGPVGSYLLQGPFDGDGACLVLELAATSYPGEPGAEGAASVRWWERGTPDPGSPTECFTRRGEVTSVPATVVTVTGDGSPTWSMRFTVGGLDPAGPASVEIEIVLDPRTPDLLRATVVAPEGVAPLAFDRVDSIDPPLAPAPSSSPGS